MAVSNAHVFPGFLTPVLLQSSFKSHRLFSHASAEVRGGNRPERNFVSTGSQTRNHKVMSPTRSPLSHPGKALSNQRTFTISSQIMQLHARRCSTLSSIYTHCNTLTHCHTTTPFDAPGKHAF